MRDLRNHTREVIRQAQFEPVTITDSGVPIAVLSAVSPEGAWNAERWLGELFGSDWVPYDSGLAEDVMRMREEEDNEPDALERLGLS